MVAFDLALGTGALLAPKQTLRVLGHDAPSADAEHLFRRCGPIWLTFAAAHALAARRGDSRDGGVVPCRCGAEIAADALWSRSTAVTRPGARVALVVAGASNLSMALGFA